MADAVHIELDVLCLIVLFFIAWQSARNVNQQMQRVLFRWTTYGIMCALTLDALWLIIDGRSFPGNIILNSLVNAAFLSLGVVLGCIWYLYVLETLGYHLSHQLTQIVMLPGYVFTILNFLSMKTGWIFFITPENVYVRGQLFILQTIAAVGILMISLIHLLAVLITGHLAIPRHEIFKLLGFYLIPVIGTLASLPYTGMPGTWTCASISIILIYLANQDREILRDGLTGLNNRKTLSAVFADYSRQVTPEKELYVFMIDLDHFKQINDTLGHPAGDEALILTADILMHSAAGIRSIVSRFGGDEFLIMGFFSGEQEAEKLKKNILTHFEQSAAEYNLPYRLTASIGYSRYEAGQSLGNLIEAADAQLYEEKKKQKELHL